MRAIYSNGVSGDWVRKPFERLARGSQQLWLAAPYFTFPDPIVEAAQAGKSVQLLVGLNMATHPDALQAVHGLPGVSIRFHTRRFHAKIYVFDDAALLGSSNLTDGGLQSNREATILLAPEADYQRVEEVRALFADLWSSGRVLTKEKLRAFRLSWMGLQTGPDPDAVIEKAVGKSEPVNIAAGSQQTSKELSFLEPLRRDLYERYQPSFVNVETLLTSNGLHRPELASVGTFHATNRFLNWLRLTHIHGDEAWKQAPQRQQDERADRVLAYGREWLDTLNDRVTKDYAERLAAVVNIFGSRESIEEASQGDITNALMSLHAFSEQSRFVSGGPKNLPAAFWEANAHDPKRVKASLAYLVHGPGEFLQRLHDLLYAQNWTLGLFARFCALELYGTIFPDRFPPINSRMLKAMKFLGYPV